MDPINWLFKFIQEQKYKLPIVFLAPCIANSLLLLQVLYCKHDCVKKKKKKKKERDKSLIYN